MELLKTRGHLVCNGCSSLFHETMVDSLPDLGTREEVTHPVQI